MLVVTALFLTVFGFISLPCRAQETTQEWSKKVIELREKEGQNFEQDLQLARGFIHLHRRAEAQVLLSRLLKSPNKKDPRLKDLFETASNQFFFQDTAELYADAVQLIREESWQEAKEKVEVAIQKENHHRQLILRAIQLGLILGQNDFLIEPMKVAENIFSELPETKVYGAWASLAKNDAKEAHRVMSALWVSDRKVFESSEAAMLAYLQAVELTKHSADWPALSKIIQKHPEWIGVRFWRLKNKSFAEADRKKEIVQLKELFQDLKKLKTVIAKENQGGISYYFGLVSVDKIKTQFEEYLAKSREISEKD